MIKFLVKGKNIETLEHEIIAADQIAFVKVHFAFDNRWKVFRRENIIFHLAVHRTIHILWSSLSDL